MEVKDNLKTKPQKKTFRRIIQVILIIFVVLAIFVIFAVPAIISSGQVRQMIISKINDSVGGKTEFSDLSMGWFKGVNIADFSYNDNSGWISVKVKNISAKPDYASLLTGNLNLGQTKIDMPQVEINMKDKPPAAKATSPAEPQKTVSGSSAIALATDLHINDGNVKVTGTDSKTVELEKINSNINIKPPGEQSSFTLGMVVAANNEKSTIDAKGQITPPKKSGWTIKSANGDVSVTVNKLDLESLGPFLALANADIQTKGDISVDLKGQLLNGQLESLTGSVTGSNLDISAQALKGDSIKTKILDASVNLSQKGQMISIDKLNVKTDWANLDASGELPTTINSLDSLLASNSKAGLNAAFNCNVAQIVSQIPNVVGLKQGTTISSGTLKGNISTLDSSGKKQIQAIAQLTDLKGLVEGKQVALSSPVKLDALVSPDQSGININRLDVTASFASLDCSGNLKSIKYNAKTDLTKLQSEIGQFLNMGPYQVAGAFSSDGTVSIGQESISTSGLMELDNLRLSTKEKGSISEPKATVNFALNLNKKDNVLTAENLKANTSFGQVSVKDAKVPLKTNSSVPLNATVAASNIDLAKLKPYAIMFSTLPKEMNISGIAQSEISVSSQKQTYIVQTDSTKIKNLKLTYPGKKPFDQNDVSVVFEAQINPEQQTIVIEKVKVTTPQIKIQQGSFSDTSSDDKKIMKGQIDCEFDWSAVSELASDFMPSELTLKGQRKDKINFSSEYPLNEPNKILPNLNANADLGFQSAGYMGLNFGPTDVNIAVQKGLLKIAPFSTTVNQGKFNFGAQADFKKQPTVFKIDKPTQIVQDIKINDDTTRKLLKYLNPIFSNATNVSGVANLYCNKLSIPLSSAAKNDAEIVGTVSIAQLRLQTADFLSQIINLCGGNVTGTTLTIHPTNFTLQNGVLKYDNMQIDIDRTPVNFAGSIGLDKKLDMTVTLPYTFQGRTVRVGQQNTERITLSIGGTIDKPKLDLGKLLQNTLQNELQNQIQKGLEGLLGGR